MASLTLNFSLNLAIMRYVPARLWLRTDEMSILVQDRRGQRDPRKRPRARGAIMARPRCKPHRPFYFLLGQYRLAGERASREGGYGLPSKHPGAQVWGQIPGQLVGTTRYSAQRTDCIRHRRQGSGHGEGQLDARGSVRCWDRGGHCRIGLERMRVQSTVHVHDTHD